VISETTLATVGERYISFPDLVQKGIVRSRMTLWRLIQDQDFPAGFMISPGRRAWAESEVDAWVKSRPVASTKTDHLRASA
jgi:predicted DNA-binding transcriptional regulator AlpA